MENELTRRNVLKLAAGAAGAVAGSHWVFRALPGGRVVKAAAEDGETFKPSVLTPSEIEQLAPVCEGIIPRTDTPGARDARVHEYIDVALSVENAALQKRFRDGLAWLEDYCKKTTGKSLAKADAAEIERVLTPLSDANATIPDDLRPGASFFTDVKGRTIFGYYTSREGWVEELGRPEHVGMETWTGCTHPANSH